MKKYIYGLVALLAFAACSNEKEILTPNHEGAEVHVKFPGRTFGTPKTYAGTFPAEAVEKSLGNVRVFVFNDDNGQPGRLVGAEKVTVGTGDPETGVSASFFTSHFGKLHFVAVANLDFDKDRIDAMGGIDFGTFSKTMVTQPSGVPNAFVMASEPVEATLPDPQSGTPAPALSFLLERLSARIDIENLTSDATGGEFVLTGARIYGNIDRSYLIKGQSPAITNGVNGAVNLPIFSWTNNHGVNGDLKKMYTQLYTYENVANAVGVEVKGTFKGVPAQFFLPFGDKEVKRNTRYLVRINNFVGSKVAFDIVVDDWNEGGDITFKPEIDRSKPVVIAIEAADGAGNPASQAHTLSYSSGSTPNDATGIALTNPTLYHTKITLESSVASMILVNKAEVPWLTVKELGQVQIADGKMHQEFLVTYGASNDRYPRTAQLEIQNRYYPDKIAPKLIAVSQPANATSGVLLARFANANVDNLNQFAAAITPDNAGDDEVRGKFYQWGRNVPFDYVKPSISNVRVAADDPAVWSNTFITPTTEPYNWLKDAVPGDTWTTLVNKATDAPASYTGTNGGEPCPEGWRLPVDGELFSIFPDLHPSKINFQGNVNTKDIEEKITINGASADYRADYYSTKPNVIYALKMKSADNSQLTAYRYETRGILGLWVTARPLGTAGAAVTVEQVADEEYWKTNAYGDVIRYFPSTGVINIYGDSLLRGIFGAYLSSTEGSADGSLQVCFDNFNLLRRNHYKSSAFSLRCVRD